MNKFLTRISAGATVPSKWYFSGTSKQEALTRPAFDLSDPTVRISPSDIVIGTDQYGLAMSIRIWSPAQTGTSSDWGLGLSIDWPSTALTENDMIDMSIPPKSEVRDLVEIGADLLEARSVRGIVFDPDWRSKIRPNEPVPVAPEVELI